MASVWADTKNIDLLKQLWAEGHSCSQIAAHIPGTTRNGVIGKLHRMGLSGRSQIYRAAMTARATRRKKVRCTPGVAEDRAPHFSSKPLPKPRETDIARISFNDLDEIKLTIPLDDGTTRIVTQHCRYRIPDTPPDCRAVEFCGDQRVPGSKYCHEHKARCEGAPPVREIVKPAKDWVLQKGGTYRTKEFA